MWAVEGEESGFKRWKRNPVLPTNEFLAEHGRAFTIAAIDQHRGVAELEREFYRVRDPTFRASAHDDPVHHDIEVVRSVLVGGDISPEVNGLSVDACAHVSITPERLDFSVQVTPFGSHERRHQRDAALFTEVEY